MADSFDLQNLELDDNTFRLIPDGDYHFTVASHEVGYSSSDKLPPNTQQITLYLDIPVIQDGEIEHVEVRSNLNVCKKTLFAVRQFVEAVGMVPEKGRTRVDMNKVDGLTGVCAVTTYESKNGNEFNQISSFYPPSKVPAVCANDDAWMQANSFLAASKEAIPFNV